LTQTSKSMSRDCHSDSARWTASCVLPTDARQSGDHAGPTARSDDVGVNATAAPGASTSDRPGADSGLATKPSARGGRRPDLIGQVTAR
jgi:hypothetical protein